MERGRELERDLCREVGRDVYTCREVEGET